MEPEKVKILSKFFNLEPLKKMIITQLLLSLSLFSFVISYYSLCSSPQSHSRELPCLSANPFNLHSSSHAVNKNYIFLICNALLVFLSKTSRSLRSSSGFDLNEVLQKRVGDGLMLQTYKRPKEDEEEDDRILIQDHRINSMESNEDQLRGICDDHGFEADADRIHDQQETQTCLLSLEDESMDDQQDVTEEEAMSTEELNKKFEEFIRKTKEEIMMNEARQLANSITYI